MMYKKLHVNKTKLNKKLTFNKAAFVKNTYFSNKSKCEITRNHAVHHRVSDVVRVPPLLVVVRGSF